MVTWAYINKNSRLVDLILDYEPDIFARAENGINLRIAVAYKWGIMSYKLRRFLEHRNIKV
jgi:hypothetical protein